jgi:hypothetical protein
MNLLRAGPWLILLFEMTDPKPEASQTPATSDADDRISFGDFTLHNAFQQEISAMLDAADISEEEKQQLLIAMNCPCCGAGGMSLTIKLKGGPGSTPSF